MPHGDWSIACTIGSLTSRLAHDSTDPGCEDPRFVVHRRAKDFSGAVRTEPIRVRPYDEVMMQWIVAKSCTKRMVETVDSGRNHLSTARGFRNHPLHHLSG